MHQVHAQSNSNYTLLEPLANSPTVSTNTFEYFQTIYTTTLWLTIALAFVMIVISGIQYSAAFANPSNKEDAKKRIYGAIGGLLLALFSVLILQTVNPALVNLSSDVINLPGISTGGGGGGSGGGTGAGGGGVVTGGLTQDAASRKLIDAHIGIAPGIKLAGVQERTLNAVISVHNDPDCKCSMTVTSATGGTTHDADAGHYQGLKVDVRLEPNLEAYIRSHFTPTTPSKTYKYEQFIDPSTKAVWMLEKSDQPHWDVDATKSA